jgi:excisionase family DNA binding protein
MSDNDLTPDDEALLAKHSVLMVDEVSRILRLSRMATYQAVWSGKIPSVKIGRSIRVPVAAVKAMLGEADAKPDPAAPTEEAAA